MTTNGQPSFKLDALPQAKEAIKEFAQIASAKHFFEEFVAAAKKTNDSLQTNPRTYGEPRYVHKQLDLEMRVTVQSPLVVLFAVHLRLDWVCITEYKLLPGFADQ